MPGSEEGFELFVSLGLRSRVDAIGAPGSSRGPEVEVLLVNEEGTGVRSSSRSCFLTAKVTDMSFEHSARMLRFSIAYQKKKRKPSTYFCSASNLGLLVFSPL